MTNGEFKDSAKIEDLRARLQYPDEESALFDEAAGCIEAGLHRAAVIMAWVAAAEGIKSRFRRAAAKDSAIADVVKDIKTREEVSESIDTLLLDKAGAHGLIDKDEKERLNFLRSRRNKSGHPTGAAPTLIEALAALETAVDLVLSRPERLSKSYAEDLVKQASTEPTFFPHDPVALRHHVAARLALFTEEAVTCLVKRALDATAAVVGDPDRQGLVGTMTALASTVFIKQPQRLSEAAMSDHLTKRNTAAALICLDHDLFVALDDDLARQALASVLKPPNGSAATWCPKLIALAAVGAVLTAKGYVDSKYKNEYGEYTGFLHKLTWSEAQSYGILMADRLCIELESHDTGRQNEAVVELSKLDGAWVKSLDDVVQVRIAAAFDVAMADDSGKALWLARRIDHSWPPRFPRIVEAVSHGTGETA